MVDTVLFSQTRDGAQVAELPQATDILYTLRLNAPGAIAFSLPAEKLPGPTTIGELLVPATWEGEPITWEGEQAVWPVDREVVTRDRPISQVLEDGVHEIGIRRAGQVVWLGPLLTVDEQDTNVIRFGGEGLPAYMRRWHILSALAGTNADGVYDDDTTVDSGLLARRLIDHHQAKAGGDFGIDSGDDTTGVDVENSEVAPWKGGNVYSLLTALSEADDGSGFDWEIPADTRRFTIHHPQAGIRRLDLVLDRASCVSIHRRRDATQQASAVIGFGDGDEAQTLRRVQTNSSAVSKYGLTERVVTFPSETSVAALDAQVQAALAQWKTSPNILAITFHSSDRVPLFGFDLGDELRVVWDSPWRPIDEWRRVLGIDVRPGGGNELVTVYVDEL